MQLEAATGSHLVQFVEACYEAHVVQFSLFNHRQSQVVCCAGFVKLLVKPKHGTILGATIVGSEAGNMISEITVAMHASMKLGALAAVIHPYPTKVISHHCCCKDFYSPFYGQIVPVLQERTSTPCTQDVALVSETVCSLCLNMVTAGHCVTYMLRKVAACRASVACSTCMSFINFHSIWVLSGAGRHKHVNCIGWGY